MKNDSTIYNLAAIMKKALLILFIAVFAFTACENEIMPKPEQLIKEKKMINMLVDVHLADAAYTQFRYDSVMLNSRTENFYYSVLDKYEVPDSVFEQSLVYYASFPKDFEKMYRKVMSQLSEIEQEHSGRKEELLKFEEEEN
ncbi:DUF4296 domain-containing protein [Draconibacterium halophilum]|uniref:DUF4296 domain-containing protein n=1 Tax=Draconibacterium halophilum TaxID=2706887 RepID=A0A6C0RGG6_9BACT|nr:DUF4296 domain-containing protein [Draconibacterium halophilum]QIA09808.1 DUF4296 domain-containing protein [Draconibacterium halophilum]